MDGRVVKVKMDENVSKDHKTDKREDFRKKINCDSAKGFNGKKGTDTEGREAPVLDEEMKGWRSERDIM